ncbi:MAG: ribonuclease R [Candidatus Lloydbacteria bacterium CG22_combo_CG10-13_8_21_14_all_47_15]|uniref:Ribonuclease R n=1 Tax=Candidatus Lloydbacteria bacterium CG22_combo_CG10-13_8_21_14_all_47_15 TaxID=1974635 RepID=A0A2H0CT01_9BACT|nr:MAG: ribonuclease R [Candidatus Lloydbacteria bacterium CG22_combo_CG10-13_8_21_14_all_47_15]
MKENKQERYVKRPEKRPHGKYDKPSTGNTGKIVSGTVRLTARGVGYVEVEGYKQDIEIDSSRLNTALHGDRVKVQLLPRVENRRQNGEILEIIFRERMQFVGTVNMENGVTFVVADNPKMYTNIILPPHEASGLSQGEKVYVKITQWQDPKENPLGALIKKIGQEGVNNTEMEAIVLERGFDTEFPTPVEQEAAALKNDISADEISKRRDMRDILTFTIDPKDAKDFDDALSFHALPNGTFEIGVHIADVTHYVRPDTALDKEALKRATSLYLVDRTIPMLPETLSNNICSLRPNEDRLTFSAIFSITKDGQITSEWFGRAVIHSDRRLTYEEAQTLLDTPDGSDLSGALNTVNEIAKHLRKKRFEKGAIDFESTEVYFELDPNGKPLAVRVKSRLAANKLIEEWMLLANKRVAEYIAGIDEHAARAFVYRIHDMPDEEKVRELSEFLKTLGYTLKQTDGKVHSKDVNALLKQAQGTAEETLINIATLRSMAKAIYATDNIGHYGLAFEHYTHFTSPIRRYPDIVVHRLLAKYLAGQKVSEEELSHFRNIADYSSRMEQAATDAERASIKYKHTEYLSTHVGEIFDATITGVTEWGMYAETNATKSEGMVRLGSLKGDFYVLDPKHHVLRGERTKKAYRIGDSIRIKVVATDLKRKTIDFVIAE